MTSLFLLFLGSGATAAASVELGYRIQIAGLELDASLTNDGALTVVETISVRNMGAQALEFLDVPLPVAPDDLVAIRATLNGEALPPVRYAHWLRPGVEVRFGAAALGPGEEAEITVRATVQAPLEPAGQTADKLRLTMELPFWPGENLVGEGRIDLRLSLPATVQSSDVQLLEGFASVAPDELGWVARGSGPVVAGTTWTASLDFPADAVASLSEGNESQGSSFLERALSPWAHARWAALVLWILMLGCGMAGLAGLLRNRFR